jgi:hypothetical protein
VGWLAVAGAGGSALLALGHAGIEVPIVSTLGPGDGRSVPAAAIGFSLVTLAYATVAAGVFGRRRWAWPAAFGLNALAFVAGIAQFRGPASAVGLALCATALALLLVPDVRRALVDGRRSPGQRDRRAR